MPCYTITFFTNYGEVEGGGHEDFTIISSKHIRTFIVDAQSKEEALSIFVDNYHHHRSIREFLVNMIIIEPTLSDGRLDECDDSFDEIDEYIDTNGLDPEDDEYLFGIIDENVDNFKDVVLCAVKQDPSWISVQRCETLSSSGNVTKSARIGGRR